MHNKKAALIGLFLVLSSLLAFSGASGSTKFSSTTGKTCADCHDLSKLPALNAFGQKFKANGYKIVSQPTNVKIGTTSQTKSTTSNQPKTTVAAYKEKDFAASANQILKVKVKVNSPNSSLTRSEAYLYLANALGWTQEAQKLGKEADNLLKKYKDRGKVPARMKYTVALFVKKGLVQGNTLNLQSIMKKNEAENLLQQIAKLRTVAVKPQPPKPVPLAARQYVGSKRCGQCHTAYYQGWQETYHSKMIQPKEQGILRDAVLSWTYDDAGNQGPTIGNATKTPFTFDDVVMVIGSRWKQRYLVKNPQTGGYQLMNKQFNAVTRKWENYGNANDWDTECITCHSTGYKILSYDEANPSATKVAWAELNVGCEACHGPGSAHVVTANKADIFNPAKASKQEQARICGYCHIRLENDKYKSRQGKPREDFPAPTLNTSWKPWDDWTKWYPEEVVIPGVQPEDPASAPYTGDLQNLFIVDDKSVTAGVYEENKHHQQYQGFIQSKHYQTTMMNITCTTCHNPHKRDKVAGSLRAKPEDLCAKCHTGAPSDLWKKIMPGTGKTAENLYVRTHTFKKGQDRLDKGMSVYGLPEPIYFFGKR
ncbi:MAG: cytochrome c3 family protein [Bacillota bacterium]